MPAFFLTKSYFKSVISTIKVKRLFKKYLKRRKLLVRFRLSLSWLHISEKNIKYCNCVGAGPHKVGKVFSFWPNFALIFPIFGEREKGKFYILKKVGLSTLKETL